MVKVFSFLCAIFILNGCWLSLNFSSEIQDKWRGKPIADIADRLGPFQMAQNKNGEKYLFWKRSFQKSTPYGSELAYCETRAFYNDQGKITRLDTYTRGANCALGFRNALE